MDRAFDRLFSQAVAGESAAMERQAAREAPPSDEPEKVADAISKILDHWKNKEYFMLMQLDEPTADELGRPSWPCTSGDVSKAYRKLSVLVHPDKNPGEDARKAFEALNETHRILKDPGRLEEVMRDAAAKAVRERERAEACASAGERVEINARKNARAKELRKEEGKNFQSTIMEQMKRKQEEVGVEVEVEAEVGMEVDVKMKVEVEAKIEVKVALLIPVVGRGLLDFNIARKLLLIATTKTATLTQTPIPLAPLARSSRALELQRAEEEAKAKADALAAAASASAKKGSFDPARPPQGSFGPARPPRPGARKKEREESEGDSDDGDRSTILKKKKKPTFI
eukprot:gene20689-27486_t